MNANEREYENDYGFKESDEDLRLFAFIRGQSHLSPVLRFGCRLEGDTQAKTVCANRMLKLLNPVAL